MAAPALLLATADSDYEPNAWKPAEEDRPSGGRPVWGRRVLVVDDEPIVRSFLARLLEEAGYDVQAAPDGAEALRAALAHPTGFDLVISDIRMPGMDGWELGRRLRSRWPELPVLYISGYDLEQAIPSATAFLRKPFDPSALLDRVARLLGHG